MLDYAKNIFFKKLYFPLFFFNLLFLVSHVLFYFFLLKRKVELRIQII